MIADAAWFLEGVRQQEEPLSLEQAQTNLGRGLVWVSFIDPSADELAEAQKRFGLHPVAVEDAGDPNQRPKIQEYDDHLFLALRTARYDDNDELVEFGEIHAFVGRFFVVVVHHGVTNSLKDALIQSERAGPIVEGGVPAAAWAILDKVIDDYGPVISGLEKDIEDVERAIFEDGRDQTQRIYLLRRELSDFHRAVRPLLFPLETVERGDYMSLTGDLNVHFRSLADHLRRLNDEVLTQRYLLEGVLQANLAAIAVRQNEVVRKVSGWAAIITVPTLIASIYGMNFERMPELDWGLGYPFALALMVGCAVILWLLLRRVRWL